MTTNIQLLRSAVAQKRPLPANLLDGQAAINTNSAEPGLFFKLNTGDLTKIGPAAITTDGTAPNSSAVGATGNVPGETWLDGRAAFQGNTILKVYNGSAWVPGNGFNVDDTDGSFDLENQLTVTALIANGTGDDSHITVPNGTTATRPSTGVDGMIRYNTDLDGGEVIGFEVYSGAQWNSVQLQGGDGDFNDVNLSGDLTVNGNSVLGDDCATDTLTINSVTTINCSATIGTGNTETLTINALVASDILPDGDATRNLGSATRRFANVFTGDLHLKNERGDWTMIEEENYLSLRDNKSGKVFRLMMEEVQD